MRLKTADLWAFLILSSMPEKPLELEGMWKSCSDRGRDGLLYVAEFKKNELIEDYHGFSGGGGNCNGKRLFHFRRTWDLKYNNFNFTTKYKDSGYLFAANGKVPNWYGCCHFRADDKKRAEICQMHAMPGDHDLELTNKFTYTIKGKTLRTNLKGGKTYLKRIEYPFFFKAKQTLMELYYRPYYEAR